MRKRFYRIGGNGVTAINMSDEYELQMKILQLNAHQDCIFV